MTTIVTARTGFPVNVLIDRSSSAVPDGNTVNQWPDLVPGVPIYPVGGSSISEWLNPAAFTTPANGTWGNAPRNLARGPGIWQTDLGLQKQMQMSEACALAEHLRIPWLRMAYCRKD